MTARAVTVGPLRTPHGLADVRFDGSELSLRCYRSTAEVIDRYRWSLVGAALVPALAAISADGRGRTALLLLAGLVAVLLLGLAAGEYADGGAARVRTGLDGHRLGIQEPDIRLMDPVDGSVRPRLVLHTVDGDLVLSGWWWRRAQLARLQRALAA